MAFARGIPGTLTAVNVRRGTLRLIFTDTTTGNGPISTSTPVTLGEPGFGATLDINEAVVGSYPDSSPIIEPVTQSLANLSIDGGGGQSLMGSGTIGGAATIAGIHSPGNSPGIETFSSNLTYASGSSQVIWELWGNTASNSPTVAYDQIVSEATSTSRPPRA